MRFVVSDDAPSRSAPAPRSDSGREHRVDDRYSLDNAFGHLKYRGTMIPCQFVDISLSGCRVRTENPFAAGALAPVQIVFLVFGLVLRMDGITQWSRGCDMGIRFSHPSFRSKNQLASLLTCLIDKDAQQTVQEVFSQVVLDPVSSPTLSAQPAPPPRAPALVRQARTAPAPPAPAPPAPAPTPRAPAPHVPDEPMPEVEAQPHHEALGPLLATDDEWPALIRFLHERTHAQGAITGLSLKGCAVRTADPIPAGPGSRVEMSFQVRGLPFQLPGTVAATVGSCLAQIRFLELSRRKREELQQVLDELKEVAATEKQPE